MQLLVEEIGRRRAEPRLGAGDRRRVGLSKLHVKFLLAVGQMAAGQTRRPSLA